ncbi:MAG TPA: APC family permease [Anaeromyxobacter sp.]|nr:APC family permease [Anaeromyxobacter sp.]
MGPSRSRSSRLEWLEYVSASIGMAFACSGFAMFGQLFAFATGWVLLAAVVTAGVFCGALSLSIGELASMYPSAPGVRTYLKAAFGDHFSLAVTFAMLCVVLLFAGVESFAFHAALRQLFPSLSPMAGMTLAIATVAGLNLAGFEVPRKAQLVLAGLIVALLVAVSLLSLGAATPAAHVEAAAPAGATGAVAAVGGAVFLYTGFEWVTPLGRSPQAYRARIPWSMPVALSVLTVVFGLLTVALWRCVPGSILRDSLTPHIVLGERWAGRGAQLAMIAVSLFATLTTFNAGLMGGSRLLYILARDRRFFSWAAHLSPRTGNPTRAVMAIAGACWLAAIAEWYLNAYSQAATICAALYAAVYACFGLASAALRRTRPSARRSYRTPLPVPVQLALAGMMGLFGLALLAAPRVDAAAVRGGFALIIAASSALAFVFVRRATAPHAQAPAPLQNPLEAR